MIAVGPGARGEDGKLHPLDVRAGDRILFGKWSGSEVKKPLKKAEGSSSRLIRRPQAGAYNRQSGAAHRRPPHPRRQGLRP